jgi:polysaccharide export outer membrane protein
MNDPQVTVGIVDLSAHALTLLGEVMRPGPAPLTGTHKLWDMIGASGGPTPLAGQEIRIYHSGDSKHLDLINVDWSKPLENQPNPQIEVGDTIQVSRAGIAYVVGQVGRIGAYPITNQHLTVSELIANAEGLKYSAAAKHSRLVRTRNGVRTITELNLPAIIKGENPDEVIQDHDLIYVPNSPSKVAITRGLQAALGLTTSLVLVNQR